MGSRKVSLQKAGKYIKLPPSFEGIVRDITRSGESRLATAQDEMPLCDVRASRQSACCQRSEEEGSGHTNQFSRTNKRPMPPTGAVHEYRIRAEADLVCCQPN